MRGTSQKCSEKKARASQKRSFDTNSVTKCSKRRTEDPQGRGPMSPSNEVSSTDRRGVQDLGPYGRDDTFRSRKNLEGGYLEGLTAQRHVPIHNRGKKGEIRDPSSQEDLVSKFVGKESAWRKTSLYLAREKGTLAKTIKISTVATQFPPQVWEWGVGLSKGGERGGCENPKVQHPGSSKRGSAITRRWNGVFSLQGGLGRTTHQRGS